MICGEVEEGTGRVCDKELPCTFTHETDGWTWGTSVLPGEAKKGATLEKAKEILDTGFKPQGETGPPNLAEVFANLPALGYGDSSGHSGTDTSAARAEYEDINGITSEKQRAVVIALGFAKAHGVTWREIGDATGWHHGSVSSALTNLHKGRFICRLADTRNGSKIYVLPTYVEGREVEVFASKKDGEIQEAKAIGWNVAHKSLCQGFRLHQVCAHSNPYEAASSGAVAS